MPITDEATGDERAVLVEWWVSWAKDEFNPYIQVAADRQAAVAEEEARAAAKAAISERMREIARMPRHHTTATGRRTLTRNAKKPWQSAGYASKGQWLADGSPGPMTALTGEEE